MRAPITALLSIAIAASGTGAASGDSARSVETTSGSAGRIFERGRHLRITDFDGADLGRLTRWGDGPAVSAHGRSSAFDRDGSTWTMARDGSRRRRLGDTRPEAVRAVPILMYHVLADPDEPVPYEELYVSPEDFRGQMRWLARNGYRAVTLRALWEHWREGRPLPTRPVVLTFDDGFRSHVRVALPALGELEWPGVLNLTLSHLRPTGDLRPSSVRRLIRAGWELGSHSATHPDLTALDEQQLAEEVTASRARLRARFEVAVDFFCYPAGRYDERVLAAVRRAGYRGATTTWEGLASPDELFMLARVRVNRSDGVAGLARKLAALG